MGVRFKKQKRKYEQGVQMCRSPAPTSSLLPHEFLLTGLFLSAKSMILEVSLAGTEHSGSKTAWLY